jgi:flavin reductase (DIM6/NTAB) family NADH-FMN oxidoreductase RutF
MKRVAPSETDSRSFYQYMIGAIAPRPIALVSTVDQLGNVNLSPFSFFNYVGIDPPVVVFAPNKRTSDHSEKHTSLNLREVPEAVVNLVDSRMVEQVSLASSAYDRDVNEFDKAGFTPIASEIVVPPRVAESLVQLECRVHEIKEIGTMCLVIAEVVLAHFSETILDRNGQIDPLKTTWVGRGAKNWYHRSAREMMFEVERPQLGIGVDSLPLAVQRSAILTGNDLGKLGSVRTLPTRDEVLSYKFNEVIVRLKEQSTGACDNFNELLHLRVKELLSAGNPEEALLAAFQSNSE